MYKRSTLLLASLIAFTPIAFAEPGETWEITSKSEVTGMPGNVPESVTTVCQSKAAGPDPQQMQEDSNCTVSDVKHSGNKITWKVRCEGDGQDLKGKGELSQGKASYQGTMQMTGTSDGQPMDVKVSYRGKRIGQPCDTASPPVAGPGGQGMDDMNAMMGMARAQMAAGMAEQCEVSRYEATELMTTQFFGPDAMCAKNQQYACKVISKDVMKKPDVYIALVKHDDTSDISIAKTCKIDMKAATKATCKKVDRDNYEDLEEACPSESAKVAETIAAERGDSGASTSNDGATGTMGNAIEGAKKLKGMFGF